MENNLQVIGCNHYSLELKHLICKEHIEQGIKLSILVQKYGLTSHSLIHDWLRKLGYLEPTYRQVRRRMYLGVENFEQLKKEELTPTNTISEVERSEIERLKKELQDAKIQVEGYQRMIEIAETELKIPIRKKYNTK